MLEGISLCLYFFFLRQLRKHKTYNFGFILFSSPSAAKTVLEKLKLFLAPYTQR